MKRRVIIYLSIAILIFLGLTKHMWQHELFNGPKALSGTALAQPVSDMEPVLEIVAEGLGQIWAIEFLPGTAKLLANEKTGSMFLIDTQELEVVEIIGLPAVASGGQGGLLDLAVSPEFDEDSFVYFTYSASNEANETATHLARVSLDLDEQKLSDLEVLYIATPFQGSTAHYGSRVVIQSDYLYMTIGDRGDKNFEDHIAQDTSNVLGTTIRLHRDGTVPEDNPFVDDSNVLNEIYTYGHRNAQGMTIHPETGEIWQSEHGERDGDEINIIYGGNNYGWPVATYSCTYEDGQDIGVLPEDRDDIINPVHHWECGSGGFPPAGMTFYDADGFKDWKGDLFVGGLASQYLAHFRVTDNGLEELGPLLEDEGWRVRDVTVSYHDGAIYAAVEGQSVSIVRILPYINDISFSDISPEMQFYTYIESIYAAGITTGFTDGTFRPNDPVTRGQTAAFLARALDLIDTGDPDKPSFTDVSPSMQFFDYIEAIYAEDITTGYGDGTFGPDDPVNRGQMAAFLSRALDLADAGDPNNPTFADVESSMQFFSYIEAIYAEGITTGYGDGTYKPENVVTRGQMAAFLSRALGLYD